MWNPETFEDCGEGESFIIDEQYIGLRIDALKGKLSLVDITLCSVRAKHSYALLVGLAELRPRDFVIPKG